MGITSDIFPLNSLFIFQKKENRVFIKLYEKKSNTESQKAAGIFTKNNKILKYLWNGARFTFKLIYFKINNFHLLSLSHFLTFPV